MKKSIFKSVGVALGALAALGLVSQVQAQQTNQRLDGVDLPRTMIWSAYPTGTTGYSQAVGIGSVLQNLYGTNLRVIPGRNDVSRMEPIRRGRADFAFGGTEGLSAQEAVRDFGVREWGPFPMRLILANRSDGCSFAMQVPRDSDIKHPRDLKGKRVPYVVGAAAPNAGFEYYLKYANLTWDDVQRVELGGYMNMVEAFIDGRLDVKWNACNSAILHRIANSPRGFRFLEFPHDDKEAVARVMEDAPWFRPHVATDVVGVKIPEEGIEVFSSPYPMLYAMPSMDADAVYSLVKIMHRHYDMYEDSAPGMEGWLLDRQEEIEHSFMPFHDGAIRYFKEVGIWTETAQKNHERRLERQRILQQAWDEYVKNAPRNDAEFAKGWMEARWQALSKAGQEPLSRSWPIAN